MRFQELTSLLALSLLSEPNTNCPPSDVTDGQSYVTTSDISISITTSISMKPSVPSLPVPNLNGTQPQFLLQIGFSGSRSVRIGQAPSYVFSQGTSTTCQFGTAFTLVDSQLFADRQLVSTSAGTPFQPFVTSSSSGNINDGFSLVAGILQWSNPGFAANSATFCLSTSNTVFAASNPSAIPRGCIPITLTQVPYTQCFPIISVSIPPAFLGPQGQQGATVTVGATGATGVPGPPGPAGVDGATGSPGANGTPGSPGINGTPGSPGANGTSGTPGINGTPGSPGANGTSGTPGINGTPGSPGANGTAGPPGINGTPGSPGANGTAGPPGIDGAPGANGTAGPPGINGTSGGYAVNYGYLGCYVSNPDGNFGVAPLGAQKILTTSIDDCATFCASQGSGSLYMTLGTTTDGDSICSCGNTLDSQNFLSIGVNFQCNIPCKLEVKPAVGVYYCGGYFGQDPLVSVFGAH